MAGLSQSQIYNDSTSRRFSGRLVLRSRFHLRGSMEEDLATPVLLQIANQLNHPHRDDALAILMSQATPASMAALKQADTAGFPKGTSESIRELLQNPDVLKPRANPKLTREEQLIAFQGIIDGNYAPFREMVMKSPDGEVDASNT